MHPDHLGRAVAGTGGAGSVMWRESEQPFGEDWITAPANDNQAGYTGHIEDAATGLVYMQARYYNPVIGRFLVPDPVGFSPQRPDMFNRFAYAGNDPVNNVDPDGKLDVYIGGGCDQGCPGQGNVKGYAARQQGQEGRTVAYFGEQQGSEAIDYINNKIASGNSEPINIIGHSYGADTAINVAAGVNGTVDTLVGIDPVSKPPGLGAGDTVPANVNQIIGVNSGGSNLGMGNFVEALGQAISGESGPPLAFQGTLGVDNEFDHEDFEAAYTNSNGVFPSAKEIVDRTYDKK